MPCRILGDEDNSLEWSARRVSLMWDSPGDGGAYSTSVFGNYLHHHSVSMIHALQKLEWPSLTVVEKHEVRSYS